MKGCSHRTWNKLPRRQAPPLALLCLLASLALAPSALASGEAPGWQLTARTYPTYIAPGGRGTLDVEVFNIGAKGSSGTITVTDTLPPGLTAVEAGGLEAPREGIAPSINKQVWDCAGDGPGGIVEGATTVTCTNGPELESFEGGGGAPGGENFGEPVEGPIRQPAIGILVEAGSATSGLVNRATISGGGAPSSASTTNPVTISSAKPP